MEFYLAEGGTKKDKEHEHDAGDEDVEHKKTKQNKNEQYRK